MCKIFTRFPIKLYKVRQKLRHPINGHRKLLKSERFTLCNYYTKQYDDYRLLLIRRIIPSIESHQSQKYKIIKEQI